MLVILLRTESLFDELFGVDRRDGTSRRNYEWCGVSSWGCGARMRCSA